MPASGWHVWLLLGCQALAVSESSTGCSGEPSIVRSLLPNTCSPIDGGNIMFFKGVCNGTTVSAVAYVDPNVSEAASCAGKSMVVTLPSGSCLKAATGKSWTSLSCAANGSIVQRIWQPPKVHPPPIPRRQRCSGEGSSAGTVLAACDANASLVDFVSFEVAAADGGRGWPFLHFTAPSGADGKVRATIPGLRPGARYAIRARAHLRGHSEGDPDAWSRMSQQDAECTAAAGLASNRVASAGSSTPRRKTRWLEVYRQNTHGELPDFLDAHNSADFVGQFTTYATMSVIGRIPITRYCVEVLDVMLPGVSTSTTSGEVVSAPYADYASCMGGDCLCQVLVDRMLARQPREQILAACPTIDGSGMCECNKSSYALSQRYTGMTPMPLPFKFALTADGHVPDAYPPAFHLPAAGHWYSHPYPGRCPLGSSVGDGGCTWQRAPLSHSVYTSDLARMGLNTSMEQQGTSAYIEESVSWQNLEVGRRAFGSLGLPPCDAADVIPDLEPGQAAAAAEGFHKEAELVIV